MCAFSADYVANDYVVNIEELGNALLAVLPQKTALQGDQWMPDLFTQVTLREADSLR